MCNKIILERNSQVVGVESSKIDTEVKLTSVKKEKVDAEIGILVFSILGLCASTVLIGIGCHVNRGDLLAIGIPVMASSVVGIGLVLLAFAYPKERYYTHSAKWEENKVYEAKDGS